ncbi:MAG: hypothetical protein ACR5LD_07680 [Symbiopectobacterium sp.]
MKRIIPHAFVPLLRKLLELLSGFRVAFWCTDGYICGSPSEGAISGFNPHLSRGALPST